MLRWAGGGRIIPGDSPSERILAMGRLCDCLYMCVEFLFVGINVDYSLQIIPNTAQQLGRFHATANAGTFGIVSTNSTARLARRLTLATI